MKTQFGRASSQACPRSGYAWMIDKVLGTELVVKTMCRTWACLGCRDRNLAAVRLKIQFGCLMLNPSYFITLTYRYDGPETLMQKPVVERHQRAFFRSFQLWHPALSWFKVPELTKRNQVHLHLIAGGMNEDTRAACEREARYDAVWRERSCVCLEHKLSALWHDITGGRGHSLAECSGTCGASYVVDAVQVVSAGGAASYLGKYLVKGLVKRQALHRRGFARRWSSSRNWPKPVLHLKGTEDGRWWSSGFVGGYDAKLEAAALEDSENPLMVRVGSVEAVAFGENVVRKARLNALKGTVGI